MGRLFDMDNKLFRFLSKVADLIILNIIFLITCIPLFTVGAALASMYEVTLKMVKDEESYIIKGYMTAFKSNFKKSTIMWIAILVIYGVFFMDIVICNSSTGTFWEVLKSFILVFALMLWCVMSYIFPLQGKFENTCKNTAKNAWFMSIKHLPTTIIVVILNSIFPLCMLYSAFTMVYGSLVFVLIGFAAVAYINSLFLIQVFEKYYNN